MWLTTGHRACPACPEFLSSHSPDRVRNRDPLLWAMTLKPTGARKRKLLALPQRQFQQGCVCCPGPQGGLESKILNTPPSGRLGGRESQTKTCDHQITTWRQGLSNFCLRISVARTLVLSASTHTATARCHRPPPTSPLPLPVPTELRPLVYPLNFPLCASWPSTGSEIGVSYLPIFPVLAKILFFQKE